MAFEIDADRPNTPAIARILSAVGLLLLCASIILVLVSFSRSAWFPPVVTLAGAGGAFVLALILLGQARTLELLALINARVKSRFALEQVVMTPTPPQAPAESKAASAPPTPVKDRVISIPEKVAREQGVTAVPRAPREFG